MGEIILILALCGVGLELFSLPLALCTMVVASGFVQADPRFSWLGSWWMIGVAGVLLCVEWATGKLLLSVEFLKRYEVPIQVDNARWVAQHVLSAGVSAIVVFALGVGLDSGERLGVLVAAWAGTGTLREVKRALRRADEDEAAD